MCLSVDKGGREQGEKTAFCGIWDKDFIVSLTGSACITGDEPWHSYALFLEECW